ncbi:MAG: phosphoribosylanthranilate isomerase [Acidobacteriota bacterium]|nr:phosphoribosylanthranilate isomerase [Acidobacteriota bacterium]
MTRIKICGITNLDDARAAVEAGADALGFNFYARSPRYLAPGAARAIIGQLPESVECVGVFVNEDSPETVARIVEESGVGAVQLHGDEGPEFCRALKKFPVIKALRVHENYVPEDARQFETAAILLDGYCSQARGGTGKLLDWTLARRTRELVGKLYLAGGLTPENVAEAISFVQPYAVDVCSGIEAALGQKDHVRMRALIAAARESFQKP